MKQQALKFQSNNFLSNQIIYNLSNQIIKTYNGKMKIF